jgi:basic membrane protein A
MNNLKKLSIIMVVCILIMSLAGCGASPQTNEPSPEGSAEELNNNIDNNNDNNNDTRIALVLAGPISDMGWNASAYEGLMLIKDKYGLEDVSYVESVTQSDMEDVLRNYAELGYDLIYAHGSEFQDAVQAVARDYPDNMFVIVNGFVGGDNIASVRVSNEQQGFLAGVFAALMTESGTVGVIGGALLDNIIAAVDGFEAGAKYIDPSVQVLKAMTGSFEDVNAAKETAIAHIENGADYITAIANQAGLGAIEAAEERGIYAIGSNTDQFDAAPSAVVVSVVRYVPKALVFAYEQYAEGKLEPEVYTLGYNEGVIFYSSFHDFEDFVPQEVKDKLKEITADLAAGKINVRELIETL